MLLGKTAFFFFHSPPLFLFVFEPGGKEFCWVCMFPKNGFASALFSILELIFGEQQKGS